MSYNFTWGNGGFQRTRFREFTKELAINVVLECSRHLNSKVKDEVYIRELELEKFNFLTKEIRD